MNIYIVPMTITPDIKEMIFRFIDHEKIIVVLEEIPYILVNMLVPIAWNNERLDLGHSNVWVFLKENSEKL